MKKKTHGLSISRTIEICIFSLIFCVSAFRLWAAIRGLWDHPPTPDLYSYSLIATGMSHPFNTDQREPVWIWCVKLALWLGKGGNPIGAVRAFAGVSFLLSGVLWYRLIRNQTRSVLIALTAYAIYALNLSLIEIAAEGLRDIGYLLALMIWIDGALVLCQPRSRTRNGLPVWAPSALSFAILMGMRINSFFPAIAFYGYLALRKNLKWKNGLLAAGVGILLFSPFLYFQHKEHRDPFHSINVHAAWYRNIEFVSVKKTGCAGCATSEEMKTDSYAGKKIKTGEWLLGMHSTRELAIGTLRGYRRLFLERTNINFPRPYFKFLSGTSQIAMYVVYCLGVSILFLLRREEVLALTFLFANFTPFLISAVNVDQRIFSSFCLWASIAIAFGVAGVAQLLYAAAFPLLARGDRSGAAKLKAFIFGSYKPSQSLRDLFNLRHFKDLTRDRS